MERGCGERFWVGRIERMDESTVVGWGDPPAEELPEYDPEFEALMQTVLAGCDNPAEVDVEAA